MEKEDRQAGRKGGMRQMEMRLKEKELDSDNETQRRDHEFRLAGAARGLRGGCWATLSVHHDDNGDDFVHIAGARSRDRAAVLADRVKRYGSALKQVISPMTDDLTEITSNFLKILKLLSRLTTLCIVECYIMPTSWLQWSMAMLITSRFAGVSYKWLTVSRHGVER